MIISTYAIILIASIAFPIILSFDRKVAFYRKWVFALVASVVVAPTFLVWDAFATAAGAWGFNHVHAWPLRIAGLPLEEVLFFFLVPFACVFIWACVRAWLPERRYRIRSWPYRLGGLVVGLAAVLLWPRFYTATLLAFTSIFLFLLGGPWKHRVASRHFWLSQLICFGPFLIVNGFLTALPVVTYAPEAILGLRIGTIPVEDSLYSFVLVGANILVFASAETWFLRRKARRSTPGSGEGSPGGQNPGEGSPAGKDASGDNGKGSQGPGDGRGRAVVVGAGLGGLAAAARLAALGWKVTVLEEQAGPGGKAGSLDMGGFRFDTGPSLLTMTKSFDRLFEACGRKRSEVLDFVELEDICAYWWPDGTTLSSCRADAGMADRLAAQLGEDPERARAYFRKAAQIHEISAGLFLGSSLQEAGSYLSVEGIRGILGLPAMETATTMHRLHAGYFRNPKTVQLFDRLATYNGSSPYRTPGTLAIIAHAEYGLGSYAVRGGIRAIPAAIEALAREGGVEFRYATRADRIVTEHGMVRGVAAGTATLPADVVVTDCDVATLYRDLLKDEDDPLWLRQRDLEPSSSGLVFYWGMGAEFPELKVNNIFFSEDYEADFRAIFHDLRCPDDPTVYVNITSKVDAGDAPPGGENWFVLVNAPYDAGQDWKAETERMRKAVIRKLSAALGRDIEALIRTESVLAPPDIARATGSAKGSLYGIASNSPLAAFNRHPNRHPGIKGLYCVGGSVHPGGGMPLVLDSAAIVADLVERYEGRSHGKGKR